MIELLCTLGIHLQLKRRDDITYVSWPKDMEITQWNINHGWYKDPNGCCARIATIKYCPCGHRQTELTVAYE